MRACVLRFLLRWRVLTVLLAGGVAGAPGVRGEGTVTTNSTTALLNALGGGGLVQLNFTGTLTLDLPLIIAADTILEGASPNGRIVSVSGGQRYRLFQVLPGIRFEIRNLILRDGLATNGAGILNQGILVASNVTFMASTARGADGAVGAEGTVRFGYGEDGDSGQPGSPAEGGAVLNQGEATFDACSFEGNEAQGGSGGAGGAGGVGGWRTGNGGEGGAGAWAYGGAISSSGTLAITNSQFSANSAQGGDGGAGGGVAGVAGSGNGGSGAGAAGGAIHSSGPLQLVRSSFTTNIVLGGNTASAGAHRVNIGEDGGAGGPAYGGAVSSRSTGAVVNVTFFTNLIAGGAGGAGGTGTFTIGDGGDGGRAAGAAVHARGRLEVRHATFAWNSGTNGVPGAAGSTDRGHAGNPGRVAGSGLAADAGARVSVVNSIFASTNLTTVDGPVTDLGHNLFTDAGPSVAGPDSRRRVDPVLSAFRIWDSGPPGLVPLSGSPALDAADPTNSAAVDQRNLPRPAGPGPDIGAMEVGALSFYLAGQVLDGSAGLPGIRIEMGSLWMLTDGNGRFRFGPMPTGFYTVAVADGGGLGFTPRLVQVPLIADATNVVFRTSPLTLQFQRDEATDRNRIATAGQPNRVYRLEGGPELGVWQNLGTLTADGQGRVVFLHSPGPVDRWFYRVVALPR